MAHKKIVAIDDDPIILKTLYVLLGNDYDVKTAVSGQEGLKIVAAEKGLIDVFIVDLMMPGSSGANFYLSLMKDYPGLENRIIFMTGGPYDAFIEQFSISNTNPCLKKPFGKVELLETVAKMVGNKQG